MNVLINVLMNDIRSSKMGTRAGDPDKINMLIKEIEKELMKAGFDLNKIYQTKDGRWKISAPIQICKKERRDVLIALYDHYYGDHTIKFADVYSKWIESFDKLVKQGHKSSLTAADYRADWKKRLEKSELAKTDILTITGPILYQFYASITANQAITRRSLNNTKSLINHIFDYAVAHGYVNSNIARTVNTKDLMCKEVDNSQDVYTDNERNAIIAAALEKDDVFAPRAVGDGNG